jgi:cytochrome b subunit of formate dehydrogenase
MVCGSRSFLVPALAAAALALGASTALAAGDPDSCLGCHSVNSQRPEAPPKEKRIQDAVWFGTPHRESCLQCHPDMEKVPHGKKKADRVDCAQCHEEEARKYATSAHGEYLAKHPEALDVPTCSSCHGTHNIHSPKDPQSPVYKKNLPDTCGRCHGREALRKEHGIGATVEDYKKSVHGVALLEKGNMKAAGCSDCHSSHELRHRRDPQSQTYKMNIPGICGNCHKEIGARFQAGIHGKALALGNMDAPACTDCHTEHSIRPPDDPKSTVYSLEVAKTTCPSCHNAERLVRKYGLPPDRVTTYQDSYHGLADREGYRKAANCGSCHGVHDVLPAADPASSVNGANLVRTCSRCHPGAAEGFVRGPVHVKPDREKAVVAYWARFIYWILIPLVIGGMFLHNLVLVGKFIRDKYREQKKKKHFIRFFRHEVAVHMTLTAAFVTLAVTGFALTYPEASWVMVLRWLGMSEPVRAWMHRVAAVLLFATALLHAGYILLSPHGRYGFRQMLPRPWKDLRDMVQNLAFHVGLRKEAPRYDRFDYTMKAEYWALVWGTMLMMATGVTLWFKVEATQFVPRWMVYVAERVHFYEGVLAVLAIVVWHFFFVMYHPDEYPMNLTWLTGRITEEELKHSHPLEYERLKGSAYEVAPASGARGGPGEGPEKEGGRAPPAVAKPVAVHAESGDGGDADSAAR